MRVIELEARVAAFFRRVHGEMPSFHDKNLLWNMVRNVQIGDTRNLDISRDSGVNFVVLDTTSENWDSRYDRFRKVSEGKPHRITPPLKKDPTE